MAEKFLNTPSLEARAPRGGFLSDLSTRAGFAYLAFAQALVATLGSLYFSEVAQFLPCNLCWYQRIFMYPLVFVLGAGILTKDPKLTRYVLPLSLTGFAISFYHVLTQYNILAPSAECVAGISCTTRWLNWAGFIEIPLLAFIAFGVITFCMAFYYRETPATTDEA